MKGPRVFLDYDQAELDAAYNQAVYAPYSEHVRERMLSASDDVRSRLGDVSSYAYGESDIERLDVYCSQSRNAPIHVFIHGGAWRRGLAKQNAFPAEMFVNHGIHYVVPDFSWVQDASNSLTVLANQVRRALIWVYRNAAVFNGNSERIYLSGHSSGAHLAAVALTTNWQRDFDPELPKDILKGGVLCSGMYDLHPVRLSSRNAYLRFDDAMEYDLSPQRHIDKLSSPIQLLFGDRETPEFQRQSKDFAGAVRKQGKSVSLFIAEHYDHFEIKESLANPYGPFGRAVLKQILG
jgi:arylformamidase